jgi:hypothetical protein
MAVETMGTCDQLAMNNKSQLSKSPTVSLSRSKIFILDDEAPEADSPTVTILEMYPEAAATTSMLGRILRRRSSKTHKSPGQTEADEDRGELSVEMAGFGKLLGTSAFHMTKLLFFPVFYFFLSML